MSCAVANKRVFACKLLESLAKDCICSGWHSAQHDFSASTQQNDLRKFPCGEEAHTQRTLAGLLPAPPAPSICTLNIMLSVNVLFGLVPRCTNRSCTLNSCGRYYYTRYVLFIYLCIYFILFFIGISTVTVYKYKETRINSNITSNSTNTVKNKWL